MQGIILTPTPDLDTSIDHYQRLGFKRIEHEKAVLFTDGFVVIEIDADRFSRAGLKLFNDDWSAVIKRLDTPMHVVPGGHICADPSGVRVQLMDGAGPQFEPVGEPISALGKCAGLCIESSDTNGSIVFWTALGFSQTMGSAESGWVVVGAGGCPGVSIMKPLMCPHLFFNPSLTYFNGKEGNPKVIAAVRKAGIPITEEITHFNEDGVVDNIIIRDPGGLGFFLFND